MGVAAESRALERKSLASRVGAFRPRGRRHTRLLRRRNNPSRRRKSIAWMFVLDILRRRQPMRCGRGVSVRRPLMRLWNSLSFPAGALRSAPWPEKRRPPEGGLSLGRKRPRRAYGDESPYAQDKTRLNGRNGRSALTSTNRDSVIFLHQAVRAKPVIDRLIATRRRQPSP